MIDNNILLRLWLVAEGSKDGGTTARVVEELWLEDEEGDADHEDDGADHEDLETPLQPGSRGPLATHLENEF